MGNRNNGEKKKDEEWPLIYKYTAEDAVQDGVFVHVGNMGKEKVYFTSNLFSEGYEDLQKRLDLVKRGLQMLSKPDPEDTNYMWLRVIEKNRIWVVRNGEGITYMKPEDYWGDLVTHKKSIDPCPRILVEIEGGVVQYIAAERDADIYIVDHDNLKAGDSPKQARVPYDITIVRDLNKEIDRTLQRYEKGWLKHNISRQKDKNNITRRASQYIQC